MTSLRLLTALTLVSACVVTKPIGDADTDSSPSTGVGPTSTDPSVADSTGDAVDPDGDPDPRYVDCAAQDWGPTVGGGGLTPLGFPDQACNPRTSGAAFGYQCCSDDPATADGKLPAYEGKDVADGSTPLYADGANGAGTSGLCVRTTDIPEGSGLIASEAENCPIPCDPTWAAGDVDTVCGAGRVCCQTRELGPKDCVQQDGVWRPVHGEDIGSSEVMPPTNWNSAAHDTHQDPNGTVCLEVAGDPASAALAKCILSLSVADRRGFCMALGPGQVCPGAVPSYVDACEAMNG